MKVDQTIAGALLDFVQVASRRRNEEFPQLLRTILGEWAADRGLDLDQANVAGWTKDLGKEIGGQSYEDRIRARYGELRGARR